MTRPEKTTSLLQWLEAGSDANGSENLMKPYGKKKLPSRLNLSGRRGEDWARVAGQGLVLECTLPGSKESLLNPPEALNIFIFFA